MSDFCFINTSTGKFVELNSEGYWPSYILTNKQDCIPDRIKIDGSWELDLITDATQYIKNDSIVLDIGANIGVWSVEMSKNKTVKIHAFEPYLPTYYNLCSNLLINKSYNVETHRCALGNSDEFNNIAKLYTTDGNIGATRLNTNDSTFSTSDYTTTMDYLDRLFPTEMVSFIKIDVEGHEENVLKGGINLLNRCKPIIYLEAWVSHRESLFKYLRSINYNVVQIRYDDFKAIPM